MSTHRPRYRYIAFRAEGPRAFSREEVLQAVHALPDPLWLVSFESPEGLVRTTNVRKDDAVRALNGIDRIAGLAARVETLGTSGTIRRATEKYLGRRSRPSEGR